MVLRKLFVGASGLRDSSQGYAIKTTNGEQINRRPQERQLLISAHLAVVWVFALWSMSAASLAELGVFGIIRRTGGEFRKISPVG